MPFDLLVTAYDPACRKRLGFHDDLSDLRNVRDGKVSYTVIGWYWRVSFDPFFSSGFRKQDRVGHRADIRSRALISTPVSKDDQNTQMRWDADIRVQQGPRVELVLNSPR